MSDSLRDQLLNAGFAAPKPKPKKKSPPRKPANRKSDAGAGGPRTSENKKGQTQPLAGHTHVPAVKAKKQKTRKPPAVKPRAGSWGTRSHTSDSTQAGVTANPPQSGERQQMKAQIQQLIENNELKAFKGEEIYRFTSKNKIRELLVTDSVRKQLVSGEIAITRLNGSTRLIPSAIVTEIFSINPQWLVFTTTDSAGSSGDDDDEFPIPDDLIW